MWLGADEFHLVWKRLKGNFILSARAQFIGKGVEPHRKIGWIVRSSLESNSPHVTAVVHGDGRTSLQFRRSSGANTEEKIFTITGADTLQLERKGDTYIASMARFGDTLASEQIADLAVAWGRLEDAPGLVHVAVVSCQVVEHDGYRCERHAAIVGLREPKNLCRFSPMCG